MLNTTDDLRIHSLTPLITPALLTHELPLKATSSELITQTRTAATAIVQQQDDRLLVIAGPCSIHDPAAALDYAKKLAGEIEKHKNELCIIMRVYFEKPRTTVGWKGLINDPHLDNSFNINAGLKISRKLLLDLAELGVPAGTEFLDTIIPQFIADCIAWGAIGARTTESQVHRELASGLSMPIGFKNGTDGNIKIAIDAIKSSQNPHHFLSITKQGVSAIVSTHGNDACHIILRGSNNGTNYDAETVNRLYDELNNANIKRSIMIDCSHGNSNKDHSRQHLVVESVCEQIQSGSKSIAGIMLESNLVEGNQALTAPDKLVYGKSITDACISWEETQALLQQLANAVKQRRSL